MFPQAAKLISRKKDHGRAEALLIAAWALGARNATVPDEEMAPVIGEMAPAIAEMAPVVEELAPAETLAAEPLP
ncbi:hypothetical protein WJX84_007150 [Apatococcus fuscideae]|uniref:DUF982 domain-containing protein n=1 Tax=Apatococcus fuscideae TaxID=2026836 RepID=A0AAW1SQ40_9CHLO